MAAAPARPAIDHITHGKNLTRILADGCLWSDEQIVARGGPESSITSTVTEKEAMTRGSRSSSQRGPVPRGKPSSGIIRGPCSGSSG